MSTQTSNETGRLLLTEKDFVDVVDSEDEVVGAVPKHWGEQELAPGLATKARSRRSTSSGAASGSGSGSTKPEERKTGEVPAGNATTEEWTAYAKETGATEADLVDSDGKALTRDALRDKYGTPPA